MKTRRLWILGLVLALTVGLGGGVVAFTGERAVKQQSEQLVTPSMADAPSKPAAQSNQAVIARGALVPAQYAALSMAASGIVAEVLVKEGEEVTAGQPLLRLENHRQRAALAEADAAVAAAQAQLDIMKTGARAQEIAAAQAAVEAAAARLGRLQEGARPGDVEAAQANLQAAQESLKRLYEGPDENARIAAAADLANAQAAVRNAQAAYDQVKDQANVGMLPQSLQLEQATNRLVAAQAAYDELNAPPDADRVAQLNAQVKQAEAALERLQQPATAAEIAEATAALRQAQAQYELVSAGARAEEIAAAEAAVAQALAARSQVEAALADTELRAPFAGQVAAIHVRQGEQVGAGMPVVEIGDTGSWQVETEDLSELDVVRVQPGQVVALTFDAIPDLQLRGTVERLQPKGVERLGDMTYKAIVRVEDPDPRLLWNMTVVVTAE